MGARAAYDDIIQAGTGMAALQSVIDGEPRFVPSVVADKTTAQAFTIAILAALVERERSGLGQDIEVPMFETLVANVMVEHLFGETFLPSEGTAGCPARGMDISQSNSDPIANGHDVRRH